MGGNGEEEGEGGGEWKKGRGCGSDRYFCLLWLVRGKEWEGRKGLRGRENRVKRERGRN